MLTTRSMFKVTETTDPTYRRMVGPNFCCSRPLRIMLSTQTYSRTTGVYRRKPQKNSLKTVGLRGVTLDSGAVMPMAANNRRGACVVLGWNGCKFRLLCPLFKRQNGEEIFSLFARHFSANVGGTFLKNINQ